MIAIASLNLAHRWYLGYNLDESLPDHSSLSKIRTRLGLPVFRRVFETIVEQCVAAGLVWGKELLFDATKVRANGRWIRSNPSCISSWTPISPRSPKLIRRKKR